MSDQGLPEGEWTIAPGLDAGMLLVVCRGERLAVTRNERVAKIIAASPRLLKALEGLLRRYAPEQQEEACEAIKAATGEPVLI